MGVEIISQDGTRAIVDPAHDALRTSLRPPEHGVLGQYSLGLASGGMAAGLAAGSLIYVFRYTGQDRAIVERVRFSAGGVVAFAAGVVGIDMIPIRPLTVTVGGTLVTPGLNFAKRRSNMGVSATEHRVATTGALGAQTGTLDPQPVGTIYGSVGVTAGTPLIPPNSVLFESYPGNHGLALLNNEGFAVRATVPATGTWVFGICVDWIEVDDAVWV